VAQYAVASTIPQARKRRRKVYSKEEEEEEGCAAGALLRAGHRGRFCYKLKEGGRKRKKKRV